MMLGLMNAQIISDAVILGSGLWIGGLIVRDIRRSRKRQRLDSDRLDEALRYSDRAEREQMMRHVNRGDRG